MADRHLYDSGLEEFFAGTYFPKTTRGNMIGFWELLLVIHEKWVSDRALLLKNAENIIGHT